MYHNISFCLLCSKICHRLAPCNLSNFLLAQKTLLFIVESKLITHEQNKKEQTKKTRYFGTATSAASSSLKSCLCTVGDFFVTSRVHSASVRLFYNNTT